MRLQHPKGYIHDDVDPAVRFILEHMRTPYAVMRAEVAAGLGVDTIRFWRYQRHAVSRGPHVTSLRRALNTLGYDLAVVDIKTRSLVL